MNKKSALVVGRVYFMATYEDPKLSRPKILSYEYLGEDIFGEPLKSDDKGHYFKFLPAMWTTEKAKKDFEVPTRLTDKQVKHVLDLDGLIKELSSRRAAWKRSGKK